jgi:NADPH2:quinone reductase
VTQQRTEALVVPRNGGSDVLEVQPRDVIQPQGDEILVRVAAAGVNFVDVYQRQGIYKMSLPYVIGNEGSGTVEEVGSDVTELAVGDVVAWPQTLGSAAGLVTIPAKNVVKVPAGVSAETAAATMLQGLTAHYLLTSTYAVQPGDWILMHAAAGGVGQVLTQLAKARGAHVIGTVSTEAKAEKARAAGADHVINYSEVSDVAVAVRELTDGVGVAAAYDGVGKTTFDASLASIRVRGTLALFGASSGQVPPFELQRLNTAGSLFVTRPSLGAHLRDRAELVWRSDEVLGAVADGSVKIEIGGRYKFADAAQAYDDLEGRRTTGKLLLIP